MKIIFFGSDDFALTNLERILKAGHEVRACVTQPDRAKGRGLKVTPSPIKNCALRNGIPLLQPEDLKDQKIIGQLAGYEAALVVVIAYGKFLPPEILAIPKLCAVNVHASLLPKYRGAAPINWALINGEKETGVSIIRLNEKMDAGDIISQEKIKIDPEDNAVTLRERLAALGADILIKTIESLKQGQACFAPQDSRQVSYALKLDKTTGLIDWRKSAKEIHNLVRGLIPWPTAYTYYDGKLLKILATEVAPEGGGEYQPGEIAEVSRSGLLVATGQGALLVKQVHPESSKAMSASSFAAGYKSVKGSRFSSKSKQ